MARSVQELIRMGPLKEATLELIDECGSFDAAAANCRVSSTQLHKYTSVSEENKDTYIPVDVVLALEQICGNPVVTRRLAELLDCTLIPIPSPDQKNSELYEDVAKVGEHVSSLFKEWALAIGNDNFIDAKEARRILAHSQNLIHTLMRMRHELKRKIDSNARGPASDF